MLTTTIITNGEDIRAARRRISYIEYALGKGDIELAIPHVVRLHKLLDQIEEGTSEILDGLKSGGIDPATMTAEEWRLFDADFKREVFHDARSIATALYALRALQSKGA